MTTVRVMEAATVLGVDLDDIDIRNRVTGANCDAGFTAVQAEAHLVTPTLQPEVFDDLVAYWRAVYADILTYSNDPRSGLMVSATIELRDGSWVAAGLGTPTGRLSVYASTVCAHYPRPNDQ